MEYKHQVQKWNGRAFETHMSSAVNFYSIGAYLEGSDDVDNIEVETLGELYRLWQELMAGDKACCEKGWKYRFYKHDVGNEAGRLTDTVTEGKVYRRGKTVFFKPVG